MKTLHPAAARRLPAGLLLGLLLAIAGHAPQAMAAPTAVAAPASATGTAGTAIASPESSPVPATSPVAAPGGRA